MCILIGCDYTKAPEKSEAYQSLSADDASANREDLVMWPSIVIVHNTNSGKRKDGRVEGMGNKEMDLKFKVLGNIRGTIWHLTLVDYIEKENHGHKGWAWAQAYWSRGKGDEKERILYGYLAITSDIDKVDFIIKKKVLLRVGWSLILQNRYDQAMLALLDGLVDQFPCCGG